MFPSTTRTGHMMWERDHKWGVACGLSAVSVSRSEFLDSYDGRDGDSRSIGRANARSVSPTLSGGGDVRWHGLTALVSKESRGRRTLIRECEAFLTGRYLSIRTKSRKAPRGWAYLNTLAHGTMDDVMQVASVDAGSAAQWGWVECRAVIGSALLALCRDDVAVLRELQLNALVPLEIRLSRVRDLSPLALVELAIAALDAQATQDEVR